MKEYMKIIMDKKFDAETANKTFGTNFKDGNTIQVANASIKTNGTIQFVTKGAGNISVASVKTPNSYSFKTENGNVSIVSANNSVKVANSEINVIGMTVDEAIPLVDKFLDDCFLAKIQTARIVHGKGTGKLRTAIQAFLKKHKRVKSFRVGSYGEGEMGVTVVELK